MCQNKKHQVFFDIISTLLPTRDNSLCFCILNSFVLCAGKSVKTSGYISSSPFVIAVTVTAVTKLSVSFGINVGRLRKNAVLSVFIRIFVHRRMVAL